MMNERTADRILAIARDLLASEGLGAVSFDAIARRLGRSKQAVLYWFPSKRDLLTAMFLPWLQAEADVAAGAVAGLTDEDEAIKSFIHAIADYHLNDLDRFRMMYLVPQTLRQMGAQNADDAVVAEQIHPVTDYLYGVLAEILDGEPLAARRKAVAIHSAVLGVVLMVALAESVNDPLKHSDESLIDALILSVTAN